jgi:hypothetical protein
MSARIVVNLTPGPAECSIDHITDGAAWLSLWKGPEAVIVKLSTSSLEALERAIAKELSMTAQDAGR